MPQALCGAILSSRRGLLAFMWSCVNVIASVAFVLAIVFSTRHLNRASFYSLDDDSYYTNSDSNRDCGEEGGEGEEHGDHEGCGSQDLGDEEQMFSNITQNITSKAMAFAALWTAGLSILMGVFGTIILGVQSPTGEYYSCCASNIHRTSPIGLGSFIGALLMFANVTLVCAVLFGEFEVREFDQYNFSSDDDRNDKGEEQYSNKNESGEEYEEKIERSALAFSIMCMFLTAMYAGFAAFTYLSSDAVLQEFEADERLEGLYNTGNAQKGYIDQRFDVRPSAIKQSNGSGGHHGAFVAPTPIPPSTTLKQHHYSSGLNDNPFDNKSLA